MPVLNRDGLLEREREFATLDCVLERARGGAGGVVIVEGPAGIGKTRLLTAARERAVADRMTVVWARGDDLEHEFAYGVVRQLLERVVSRDAGDRRELLAGVAAHAARVFSVQDWPADGSGARPSAAGLEHALFWLVANLADRAPLLVAVDDAHWADEASLRFLHYLARRVDEVPVALVAAARRAADGRGAQPLARIAAEPQATVLALRVLSPVAASTLVRSVVGEDAEERLCTACFDATGGNPLLLRELAGVLRESGVPRSQAELDRVGRLVPDTVTRHVLVRLARQPPAANALARAAAVLGDGVELRHAAALAGLDETAAAEAFDALVAADILRPVRPLRFTHPLLREVVYADLAPGERALAHETAARQLADAGADAERTASHLLLCEPAAADWAVGMLRAAARDAGTRGASRSAAAYLTRALDEPPTADARAAVLVELGEAEARAALPSAVDHLGEAMELTDEATARARIAQRLVTTLQYRGELLAAVALLERSIPEAGEGSPELLALEAEAAAAAIVHPELRRMLAPRLAAARARAATVDGAAAAPLLCTLALERACLGGTAEEAAALAQRALASGQLLATDGPAVLSGVVALILCDRLPRAEDVIDDVIAGARARGSIQMLRAALAVRAFALNRGGRLAEAEADARLAVEPLGSDEIDGTRPFKLGQLADALIERGELSAAAQLGMRTALAPLDPHILFFQYLRYSHARLLLLEGRQDEALEELEVAQRVERAWSVTSAAAPPWRSTAALIHQRLGRPEQAAHLAGEQLHAARAFGAPRAIGIALRTTGLLAADIEQLHEAVAALQSSPARLEHARTLVDLGAALRRAGHRTAAREPLRTALELAYECSARPLCEVAHQELLASGARARRPRGAGRDALTPSEQRISAMAADGLSNREIAQALYLSLKTVEMHLSRAYRKLDIDSRHHLASALAAGTN